MAAVKAYCNKIFGDTNEILDAYSFPKTKTRTPLHRLPHTRKHTHTHTLRGWKFWWVPFFCELRVRNQGEINWNAKAHRRAPQHAPSGKFGSERTSIELHISFAKSFVFRRVASSSKHFGNIYTYTFHRVQLFLKLVRAKKNFYLCCVPRPPAARRNQTRVRTKKITTVSSATHTHHKNQIQGRFCKRKLGNLGTVVRDK